MEWHDNAQGTASGVQSAMNAVGVMTLQAWRAEGYHWGSTCGHGVTSRQSLCASLFRAAPAGYYTTASVVPQCMASDQLECSGN